MRDDPAREAPILARTPMGRWGEPADVVGPVLFLAGADAGFVTGASSISAITSAPLPWIMRFKTIVPP